MARKRISLRDYKLVFRPSCVLVKCTVLVAILLSTVALVSLRSSLQSEQAKMEQLRRQAVELEQQNTSLQQDLADLGTVESVKRIAREQLDLVDPNTTFFCPTE